MDDLIAWLKKCIDEDGRVASSVDDNSLPWRGVWKSDNGQAVRTYNGWVLVYPHQTASLRPGLVEHIAHFDPRRQLDEVAAKRAILDEYESAENTRRQMERMAADDPPALLFSRGMASQWESAVRAMALAYASRPGYRPEWAPC